MKPMNEDMKQMSQGYETARTKGTFKTRRQTKQIYIYNKTDIDTLKIVVCVCVCVTNTTKLQKRLMMKTSY